MQGIISGIKRGAVHDGEGLRTTVFFKGCPLRCLWCHNPECLNAFPEIGFAASRCLHCGRCEAVCPAGAVRLAGGLPHTDRKRCTGCGRCARSCPSGARHLYGEVWEAEALADKLSEDRPFFEIGGGGVTLSGGECLSQPLFAPELAASLKNRGIRVAVDTCGFAPPEVLRKIAPLTDQFLYDLKAADPETHRRLTGQDNSLILDNLRMLCRMGSRVEIRIPLVPGLNDGEIAGIGAILADLPVEKVKVLGFHTYAASRYRSLDKEIRMPEEPATEEQTEEAVRLLSSFGLNVVNGMRDD